MSNKGEEQYKEINIPILAGSSFDLTKFDFSFKDISIYDIESESFEKYIESLNPNLDDLKEHNLNFIKQIRKEIHSVYDKKYAIVKINPRKDFGYVDIINVWRILLIIYPSDLQIEHIIHYQDDNKFIQALSMSSWNRRHSGDGFGHLLFARDEDVVEVNNFIKLHFDRFKLENYIGIAIENYLTSFDASHFHYQYLTLCIALESTIYSSIELNYRLRRTIAILGGKDEFNCNIIFDNLNRLYSLRSKIIHGEEYSIDKVKEYMQPLRAIVSRTIIELIIHNISSNKELNEIVTKLGFGDRKKISESWKSYQLNISTIVDSNWTKLK